jgi:hypothetical protein
MYLDSGQPAGQVRQETGKPFQLPAPQPVRRPVQQQGVETGVAGYDLPRRPRRRIALENDCDIFPDMIEHSFEF